MLDTVISRLNDRKIKYISPCPMKSYTTFKIGGKASIAVFPKTPDELIETIRTVKGCDMKYIVLGRGSNVLFSDQGYDGAVIVTTKLSSFEFCGNMVCADAGMSLTALSSEVGKRGLSGLEFANGIPGSVGGAVYMNAGAYGSEIRDTLVWSKYYDARSDRIVTIENSKHCFDYRHSIYRENDNLVVLRACFELTCKDKKEVRAKMDEFMCARKEKQPLNYPSAGSTFKRYPGYFTGKLIEEAGLKGFSVGGAQVSEKHAGFIINKKNATSEDVLCLIEKVKEEIYKRNGIEIECEVEYVE